MLLPSPYMDMVDYQQNLPVEMTTEETHSSGGVREEHSGEIRKNKDLLSIMWNKTHAAEKNKNEKLSLS